MHLMHKDFYFNLMVGLSIVFQSQAYLSGVGSQVDPDFKKFMACGAEEFGGA